MYGYYFMDGNGYNLLIEIMVYNDEIQKFISNSYFLQATPLHPNFYKPNFFGCKLYSKIFLKAYSARNIYICLMHLKNIYYVSQKTNICNLNKKKVS
jgi:hypothetical protein